MYEFVFIKPFCYLQIMMGACYLTICGNIVVYLTIIGFILFDSEEDNVYGGMT